nr:hypothetical protein [Tanacetum cinerariifolium]
MENVHEFSYETLTRVYLRSYEHYNSVGAGVELLEPGFEPDDQEWVEMGSFLFIFATMVGYRKKIGGASLNERCEWVRWVRMLDMQVTLHDKRIVMQVTLHYEAIVMRVMLHDKRIVMQVTLHYEAIVIVALTTTTTTNDELTLAQTLIEIKAAKPKAITTVATTVIVVSTRPKEKAMMDADYERAAKLQEKERGELSIKEKAKLFVELVNKRKRHFEMLRAEERRRKP